MASLGKRVRGDNWHRKPGQRRQRGANSLRGKSPLFEAFTITTAEEEAWRDSEGLLDYEDDSDSYDEDYSCDE